MGFCQCGVPGLYAMHEGLVATGRVIWFYLGKLLWPVDLIFIYPRWELNPMWWWQYCFPLAAIALLAILWLVRRAYRGPLAAILFFIGSLFPVLGFLNIFPFIYSFVADHFQYLPSVGIVVLVSAGVVRVLDRASKRARIAGQILCVTLLGTLMVLTRQQSRMYSDVRRLYETTLARNPGCIMCHINLGVFLSNSGQSEAAIQHYDAVVHLRPNSSAAAVAHNNIGIALIQVGQTWEAIHHYEEALRINPNYGYAHYNMGNALLKADLMPEATRHYEVAVKMSPNFPEAHNALGYVMFLKGNYFKAKEHYEAALRIRPGFAPALYNMSLLPAGSTGPRPN